MSDYFNPGKPPPFAPELRGFELTAITASRLESRDFAANSQAR